MQVKNYKYYIVNIAKKLLPQRIYKYILTQFHQVYQVYQAFLAHQVHQVHQVGQVNQLCNVYHVF